MSSKQTTKYFSSNRNKLKQDLFRLCFGLFREAKNIKFGLFRFVSLFRTCIETTEINRTVSKQTETTLNFQQNKKYALYQTVSVALLFVSVQSKHRNSLFCFRLSRNLFRLQFQLFRIETSFEGHPTVWSGWQDCC